MIRIATIAVTFAALVGCVGLAGDSGEDTWGDTATPSYQGPWQIAEVRWSCEPGSNTWTYRAIMDGWATTMTLDIVETGDGNWTENPGAVWDEYHVYDQNVAYAEDGSWDEWELQLRGVSSPGSQVSGDTTLFTCGYHSDDSLSWKATMYGDDGELDCGVWGHRPTEAFGGSCYRF